MSNFFTRSKDDMKYLFENKEELSKKERKRKRRGWGSACRARPDVFGHGRESHLQR